MTLLAVYPSVLLGHSRTVFFLPRFVFATMWRDIQLKQAPHVQYRLNFEALPVQCSPNKKRPLTGLSCFR